MKLAKLLNMKTKIFIILAMVIITFIAGSVFGKSKGKIEWLGWPVYAGPHKSIDPGIFMPKPPAEKYVRENIQIGLREDGIVVWRKITK